MERSGFLRKQVAIFILPIVLGACALPPVVTIASFAVDGMSLVSTEKTVSDHVLSAVAEDDCALWRILTSADICIDSAGQDDQLAAGAGTDIADAALRERGLRRGEPAAPTTFLGYAPRPPSTPARPGDGAAGTPAAVPLSATLVTPRPLTERHMPPSLLAAVRDADRASAHRD